MKQEHNDMSPWTPVGEIDIKYKDCYQACAIGKNHRVYLGHAMYWKDGIWLDLNGNEHKFPVTHVAPIPTLPPTP